MKKSNLVILLVILCFVSGFIVSCEKSAKKETAKEISYTYQPGSLARIMYNGEFSCSAFVVSNTLAVTAAHCAYNSFIELSNQAGDENQYVEVVAMDRRLDVALLKGDFKRFAKMPYDKYGIYQFKAKRYTSCGFPFGSKKVKCATFTADGISFFQLRGVGQFILPGHSGGPMIDRDTGLAIGVNSAANQDGSMLFGPISQFIESYLSYAN